jgi:hypothetical protein
MARPKNKKDSVKEKSKYECKHLRTKDEGKTVYSKYTSKGQQLEHTHEQ